MFLPILVMEGLNFDLLLGMSWSKATLAVINVEKSLLKVGSEEIPNKFLPELMSFLSNPLLKLKVKKKYC